MVLCACFRVQQPPGAKTPSFLKNSKIESYDSYLFVSSQKNSHIIVQEIYE
jgi:hypothetical protein